MSKETDFFEKYTEIAVDNQYYFGVPASITLAQAALESSWGNSLLAIRDNNFFGIKATPSWKGEKSEWLTKEQKQNGEVYTISSYFRKYKTAKDSFLDHSNFLKVNKRYKFLFSLPVTDYKSWAEGLKKAGYATNINYPNKLISIIEKYSLSELDKKAGQKKNT